MAKSRRFSVYKTLTSALTRASVNKPGVVATLLLNTFLERDGILTAYSVSALGLLENEDGKKNDEGIFKEWRTNLSKKGWIEYDFELARRLGKGSFHKPGKKLLPYLNKELLNSRAIASKDDVDALRAEVNELTERVSSLESTVDFIINKVDPPTSDAKRRFYIANPGKLVSAAMI